MTDHDRAVLHLAGVQYRAEGRRLEVARRELGLGATEFWAAVARLLADPDAELTEPVLVHRLRRVRDARLAAQGHGRRLVA